MSFLILFIDFCFWLFIFLYWIFYWFFHILIVKLPWLSGPLYLYNMHVQ